MKLTAEGIMDMKDKNTKKAALVMLWYLKQIQRDKIIMNLGGAYQVVSRVRNNIRVERISTQARGIETEWTSTLKHNQQKMKLMKLAASADAIVAESSVDKSELAKITKERDDYWSTHPECKTHTTT